VNLPKLVLLSACALLARAADYSTYIGDAYAYHVSAIATDTSGNTYVTGSRAVVLPSPQVATSSELDDVFVSKVDASGNFTLVATLSGKGSDHANAIALDPSGNIYIAGSTTSTNFPLRHPLQAVGTTAGTGFLVKLGADGTILYSTYLGGRSGVLNAVAVDPQGNAYVTGESFSGDYPQTTGLPAGAAYFFAAFFAKISPAGDRIVYAGALASTGHACGTGSTCFVTQLHTAGTAIGLDAAGNAYIAGNTNGVGLTGTPGVLTQGIGAFVFRVNAAGTALDYFTFLGAANNIPPNVPVWPGSNPGNLVYAIAVDAAGDAYLAGSTADPNFPATASAYQRTLSVPNPPVNLTGPPSDAFVAKLNPTGSAMIWATFLGGTGEDGASRIAADSAGNVWVSGTTASSDFPVSSGFPGGAEFLAELSSSGSALLYGTRFPGDTVSAAVALDPARRLHLAGPTGVVSTLTTGASAAPRLCGLANAAAGRLAGRVAPGEVISLYGLQIGPATPAFAALDANGFLPTQLAGVHVTINGTPAPLLYVSAVQINAVAPFALANLTSAVLQVTVTQTPLRPFRVAVDSAIPEVFRHADGTAAAALNQDGTVNAENNPARAGSYVSIWATGSGFNAASSLQDGQMAAAAQDFACCMIQEYLQDYEMFPSYAGSAPGMVAGIVQINFQIPASGFNSSYYLIAGDNRSSSQFRIFVAP
jgi:uncharacterized protein (TIGR03437 family)